MKTITRTLVIACLLVACPMQAHANKLLMPGDVIKSHAKEEENCEKCHKKFDKAAQSGLCADCHKEIGKDINEKKGFHGRMEAGKECKECHPDHKGRNAKVAEFDHGKFDHDKTDFALKGGHLKEKVKCTDCHKADKKFREAPSYCNDCHKKDDKHKGGLGTDCAKCHSAKDWKTAVFDHDKTKFKLSGKHVDVKCAKCHIDNKFKDTPIACKACHKKDDDKAHKGKLGPKCESCHTAKGWKEVLFDHDKKTKFPLLGKHQDVKCDKCHINKKYKDTPKVCSSCHKKDDDKAHKGKFGPKCETCHAEKDWKEILFDHDKKTKYPLLGKHQKIKCVDCHKGDLYKDKLKSDCLSCHEKDDKHKGQEGKKCETCHKEEAWNKTTFDHGKMSTFPLLGRHALVACKKCHAAPTFKDAKSDCWSCHEKDDGKVHKRKFGSECQTCHNTRDWKAWDFDHNKTRFRLDGPHKKIGSNCYACHKLPMDKKVLAPTACGSCHDRDDVHNGSFGDRCERCHDGNDWKHVKMGVTASRFKKQEPRQKVVHRQVAKKKVAHKKVAEQKVAKKKKTQKSEESMSVFEKMINWGGF
ncbi:MAG: cytochrome C [Gammaproteobacteria bacterium]|nr:cytochrome C [Gammaproteobacteria bacterium]MBU1481103.1 cytochrome C [Gammaproteobacteria bacterium]